MTGRREPQPDWLPYAEALRKTLERCPVLAPEPCELTSARGRALAEDVRARVNHPPWDNSAMDGFAVRREDVAGATPESPVSLPVAEEVAAGAFPSGPLAGGTAVRVMTGAPVPSGASGVIRIEHTDGGSEGQVRIRVNSDAERNIRSMGEDFRCGALVARAGDEVTPALVGLLAMNGISPVPVRRRPRIGVLSNGDELAGLEEFDEVLAGRKIMNSNGFALMAQLNSFGAVAVPLGIAHDTQDSVMERLSLSAECDGIVSTAGVSVGDHDCIKAALDALGMESVFWRVRIRPGSPIMFGVLDEKPVWGLPGNPVSAMVTAELFLRPAVRRMTGHSTLERQRRTVRLAEAIVSTPDLAQYYRVRIEETPGELPVALLTGAQGSGILSSMAAADGLVVVPEGTSRLPAGSAVEFVPLPAGR